MIRLYGLHELQRDSANLYDCGYFTPQSKAKLTEEISNLYKEIRPQFISLIEAIDVPDWSLNSSIGNSYGDTYEQQLQCARNNRWNKTDFAHGFKEHILPII